MFDEEFLNLIEENPIESIIKVVDITLTGSEFGNPNFDRLSEGFSLVLSIIESFDLPIKQSIPNIMSNTSDDYTLIYSFLLEIKDKCNTQVVNSRLENMKNKFNKTLGQSFAYEFSQGDLERIQHLITELREQISSSSQFEKKHKERLLRRLEKLQSELHKKMSDVDKFWGLIGEAGIVIGKFGKDAKPFVDRIREISDIVWRTQSRAEELPSGTPLPSIRSSD